ncbi:MAG: DUF7512 family protein [Halodesulfurarchaeum sp.]
MFGIETLSEPLYSIAIVGIVLVEALLLYVGYGVLTRIVGPWVTAAIRGD